MEPLEKQTQTRHIILSGNGMQIINNHSKKGSLKINDVAWLHGKRLNVSRGGLNFKIFNLDEKCTYDINGAQFSIDFDYNTREQIGLCKNKDGELFLKFISVDSDFTTKEYKYPFEFPLDKAKDMRRQISKEDISRLSLKRLETEGFFVHERIGSSALKALKRYYNSKEFEKITLNDVTEINPRPWGREFGIRVQVFIESLLDLFDLNLKIK